jgi:hypothetical protein
MSAARPIGPGPLILHPEHEWLMQLAFGQTAYFAGHPMEADSAFLWLIQLRKDGVGWQYAKKKLAAYMSDRGLENIRTEIDRAEKMLKPWLLD